MGSVLPSSFWLEHRAAAHHTAAGALIFVHVLFMLRWSVPCRGLYTQVLFLASASAIQDKSPAESRPTQSGWQACRVPHG